MKRVVVTGIGVVSCLGNNQDEVYKSLLNAKSGITFSEEYKEYNLKSHVHGKPNIKLEDHVEVVNSMIRVTHRPKKRPSVALMMAFS